MMTENMKQWIDGHPESGHSFDIEKWHKAIHEYFMSGSDPCFFELKEYIKQIKEWNSDYTNEFIEEKEQDYNKLKGFYEYLRNNQVLESIHMRN